MNLRALALDWSPDGRIGVTFLVAAIAVAVLSLSLSWPPLTDVAVIAAGGGGRPSEPLAFSAV